jgi:hypothetical protein
MMAGEWAVRVANGLGPPFEVSWASRDVLACDRAVAWRSGQRDLGIMINRRVVGWLKLSAGSLALTMLAPMSHTAAATAGGSRPPFKESQASTKGSSCMAGTAERSPAECDPRLKMDAKTGAVYGDLSMTTPRGGLLPGWGRTSGEGKIVAIRHIAKATRVARFEVRFHLERLDMSEEVLPCCPDEEGCKQLECWAGMGMLAGAQHMTCAACKGQSRAVRFESSKGDTDVRMLFSIRDL